MPVKFLHQQDNKIIYHFSIAHIYRKHHLVHQTYSTTKQCVQPKTAINTFQLVYNSRIAMI
jgi:hypothetical protein